LAYTYQLINMRMKLLLLCFVALFATVGAKANTSPGTGEESAKKSEVAGGVYHSESGKPLGSVVVTAYTGNKKEKVVLTDNNGNYSFDELKPGTYTFVFQKEGFKKVAKNRTINRPDEGVLVNVRLEEHSTFDFMPGPSHFFDSED
jgi:hypothetical protein